MENANNEAFIDKVETETKSQSNIDSAIYKETVKDLVILRDMKISVKKWLFILLCCELIYLGILLILQGFKYKGFELNNWTIGLFSNGCLIQTFLVIRYIVNHLFPKDGYKCFK